MKTIKLNENQLTLLNTLVESEIAPDFNDGDIKEFGNPSEVSTTATIRDNDGNPKYGKMPTGDKISKMSCPQSYWANTMNGAKMMP